LLASCSAELIHCLARLVQIRLRIERMVRTNNKD
jgi:hypothetical protein